MHEYEEWDESLEPGVERGFHTHSCRYCGEFWECSDDDCQLREDTLCLRCHEVVYPDRSEI
ncbi:MAG: hypothetical protein JNN15_17855 [Blastocatellia bacterium]|nr:hypothetical protein [Blastocatellia bacterium]